MVAAKPAGEAKVAKHAKVMMTLWVAMTAQAAMSTQAEIDATLWMTRVAQEKAVEGFREEGRELGSHLHSHCLSDFRAPRVTWQLFWST